MEVSLNQLKNIVQGGRKISWCGTTDGVNVEVCVTNTASDDTYVVNIGSEIRKLDYHDVLRNGEADPHGVVVGPVPPNTDFFAPLRMASVLGVNVGGDCIPGSARISSEPQGCACGYDIELNMSTQPKGGFPLPSVSMLSCALWCTCGFKLFLTSMTMEGVNVIGSLSSEEICVHTIDAVSAHSPMWLIGWNNFSFDNTCLAYHAPRDYRHYFKQVKTGAANVVDYGYVLNIHGVYNIDQYTYMSRNPGHRYDDMSLGGVASKLGTSAKTTMPDLYNNADADDVMQYNMNDSKVTVEIFNKLDLGSELCSLAVCSCSPLYDCVRYMTGAMSACAHSSECIVNHTLVDWSRPAIVPKFEGGLVLEPHKGVHRDVVVVDFSSMYPNIMCDANVSPESVTVTRDPKSSYGCVTFDANNVYVTLDNSVAQFPTTGRCVQATTLRKMIDARSQCKSTRPKYASALKVTSNSAYGAMGYENSPMYAPVCSASVTAIGRWLVRLASDVFNDCGLPVRYGDTDSCMVSRSAVTDTRFDCDVIKHTSYALNQVSVALSKTPFTSMTMALESYHPAMLFVDKKMYCKMNADGSVGYKGVSAARRDAIGLRKLACTSVSRTLMTCHDITQARDSIAALISDVCNRALSNRLTANEVSMVKKRDQKRCYVYKRCDGEDEYQPIDTGHAHITDFSVPHVLFTFSAEVNRFTIACGLGTVYDVMHKSTIFI